MSGLIVLDQFHISSQPFFFKMENARALLDELMGADRNVVKGVDYVPKITFESEHVCRYYLVDFCPHELFTNTKSDLGICKRLHDERCVTNIEIAINAVDLDMSRNFSIISKS